MGNLEETIDIRSSLEFSDLSDYLNSMIKSLLDNNKKMSYVLNKTNMYIGVYEYNHHMKKVHFTEYLPACGYDYWWPPSQDFSFAGKRVEADRASLTKSFATI